MHRIRELRKAQKLSQQELAAKLSVDRSTIAKWETGTNSPRIDKLRQLATVLNCSLDDLVSRKIAHQSKLS
ncbi:helix-turn-helix domain-containing protein [Selenomonas ruminantium]|uniref:helix-turn-helix domain-containing protein n=1 Tax=Selenomonas ruminantium TaxID=971 RepID=UPI00156A213A|nr:helix-turn-helix transcriptional regulator [Selenomonas ruminantium]